MTCEHCKEIRRRCVRALSYLDGRHVSQAAAKYACLEEQHARRLLDWALGRTNEEPPISPYR